MWHLISIQYMSLIQKHITMLITTIYFKGLAFLEQSTNKQKWEQREKAVRTGQHTARIKQFSLHTMMTSSYYTSQQHNNIFIMIAATVPSLSHVRLFCNSMDCSPPGSSVDGISQARIPFPSISFSRGLSWPRDWTHKSCTAGGFFTTEPPGTES